MTDPFIFEDDPNNPGIGPDEESAEAALEEWLMENYGSATVDERIAMAESLDRYDVADKIRQQRRD